MQCNVDTTYLSTHSFEDWLTVCLCDYVLDCSYVVVLVLDKLHCSVSDPSMTLNFSCLASSCATEL